VIVHPLAEGERRRVRVDDVEDCESFAGAMGFDVALEAHRGLEVNEG